MDEQRAKYRIFIVEDHPFMREMLEEYLANEPDLEVCRMAATVESALAQIEDVKPDLLLVDVSLPGMSGIKLAGAVHERWPELPCLMLSGHGEEGYVRQAVDAGARGYILKGDPEEIPGAIRKVMAGEVYVSERLLRAGSNQAGGG